MKNFIKTKYKFDELFLYSSDIMKKTSELMTNKFDIGIIENIFVNGFPKKINSFSKILKNSSSGYLYHYAFSIIFSLVVIFGIILVRVI
jgi:NADH-quinone oxidoreductase subunit L